MGRLYVARPHDVKSTTGTAALRIVHSSLASRPGFRDSFVQLSRCLPKLEHHGLRACFELGEHEGTYFISGEYLPGESLASILAQSGGPLPIDLATHMAKQAATALHFCHTAERTAGTSGGFIHGAIHPSNLLVTYHGTVKLCDFGLGPLRQLALPEEPLSQLAAPGEPLSSRTATDMARAYQSPEEKAGGELDCRTDVFRLGAMLWVCLTGQRPPSEAFGPGASLPERAADLPAALGSIVKRSLSLDAADRFRTAGELAEALGATLGPHGRRPTPKHVRRWLEGLFGADRGRLQKDVARGRRIDEAVALLASPAQSGAISGPMARIARPEPRQLWSTTRGVFEHLDRRSSLPPRPPPSRHGAVEAVPPPPSALVWMRPASIAPPRVSVGPTPLSVATKPPPDGERDGLRPFGYLSLGILGAGAIAVIGTVLLWTPHPGAASRDEAPLAHPLGRVFIDSDPPGALIFADGEPTGLRTPAALEGLTVGRAIELSLQKPGFASQQRPWTVEAGPGHELSFSLSASDGLVRLAGVPPGASLYVDNRPVALAEGEALRLSVGEHSIRVEANGSLYFSGVLPIVAGDQTIRLDQAEARR